MTILVDRQIDLLCRFQGKKITVLRDFASWKKDQTFYELDPMRVEATFAAYNVGTQEPAFRIEDMQEKDATGYAPMIVPFTPEQVRYVNNQGEPAGMEPEVRKVISYGLSSAGYDVRLGRDFKIFTNVNNEHPVIDPLNMPDGYFVERLDADYCIIPPHSHILGHTIEVFNVPRNILIECLGKSTYARCGIAVNVTPIEPGFVGQVVIEIANQTPLPCKVYSGMGIAQFIFHRADEPCQVSYGDRGGKYQNQRGIQTALV